MSAEAPGRPVSVSRFGFLNRARAPVTVELSQGDITKVETRRDLLVFSALPHSYVPVAGSVIGALRMNCGIDVLHEAADKEEDLRATLDCWISKPLPDDKVFNQFLCFEVEAGEAMSVVSNVFRSIIAMAPNAKSVVMPLLGSRIGQVKHHDIAVGIIRSFHAWTKRGLNVQRLEIVMYEEDLATVSAFRNIRSTFEEINLDEISDAEEEDDDDDDANVDDDVNVAAANADPDETSLSAPPSPPASRYVPKPGKGGGGAPLSRGMTSARKSTKGTAVSRFFAKRGSQRKSLILSPKAREKQRKQRPPAVVISFAEKDQDLVRTIEAILKMDGNSFTVLELRGKGSVDANVEQGSEIDKLDRAVKVLAIITPAYIGTPACLDHFNLALLRGEGILVPILAKNTQLPRYMTLVQYQDARPGTFRSLFPACTMVVDAEGGTRSEGPTQVAFDVFISYSQRFKRQAHAAQELLEFLMPDVRIFLDSVQLRVGGKWQKALYDSLDSSHVILALLSPSYFTSKFCQDELAIAKLVRDENRGDLFASTAVPFKDDGQCPEFLQDLVRDGEALHEICAKVVNAVQARRSHSVEPEFLDTGASMHQRKVDKVRAAAAAFAAKMPGLPVLPSPVVVLVGDVRDHAHVDAVERELRKQSNFRGIVRSLVFQQRSQPEPDVSTGLDDSALIIPILSPSFLANPECMSALHMAVFRNRQESRCLFPLSTLTKAHLRAGHKIPSFVRLLPAVQLDKIDDVGALARDITSVAMSASMNDLEDDGGLQTFFFK